VEQDQAHLRYLMTIYGIDRKSLEVTSVEVARALKVSKPAVARMLKLLTGKGLVVKGSYGRIYLAGKGELFGQKLSGPEGAALPEFPRHRPGPDPAERLPGRRTLPCRP